MAGLRYQFACLFLPEINRDNTDWFSSAQQLSLNLYFFPDAGHVDVGEVELERDTARPDPAGEEHARPELVGERRRDAAEEVPRRALPKNHHARPRRHHLRPTEAY